MSKFTGCWTGAEAWPLWRVEWGLTYPHKKKVKILFYSFIKLHLLHWFKVFYTSQLLHGVAFADLTVRDQ